MNLADTVRVTRDAARLEDATFGLLGSLVPLVPEPEVKVLLAEHALHHGWHASLWRERVPVAVGLVAGTGEAPFAEELALVQRLAGLGPVATEDLLAAVHDELARMRLVRYRSLLGSLTPWSDGPVLRALTLILADQERDLDRGLELRSRLWPSSPVS